MKNQGIYWLCENPDAVHHSRAELLTEIDYEVTFFPNLEALLNGLLKKRVSIIIVSADGEEAEIIRAIHSLASNPAIQGARLILCGWGNSNKVLKFAAGQGFRDIMQLEWEDHIWLERFEFSTAAQQSESESEIKAKSSPYKDDMKFYLPARVVWLDQEKMWIESRARPPQDCMLQLNGELADRLNGPSLNLQVLDHAKSNLVFRFSEAIIADWYHQSQKNSQQIAETISLLQKLDQGERPKVFLAVQSPALRNTILKYLSPAKYEVHTALQKRSVIMEPKFFSPHLVFIEDRLCSGEAMGRFQDMVTNLPEKSTVVVVGGREDVSSYRNFSAGRRLEALARIPKNLTEIIDKQYLPTTHFERKGQAYHLPSDHPLSFAEIELPAKLISLGEQELEIALEIPIENFGLARIESKLLNEIAGQDVYVKVSALKPATDQGFVAVCRLCNLTQDEQEIWMNRLKKSQSSRNNSGKNRRRSTL